MPTVRGLLRGGLSLEALKEFVIAHRSSESTISWNAIWGINQRFIGRRTHRYMAFERERMVSVYIENMDKTEVEILRQPRRPEYGKRKVKVSKRLRISQEDALRIGSGSRPVNFVGLGRVAICRVIKENEVVREVIGRLESADGGPETNQEDYLNVIWLEASNTAHARLYYHELLFERPITDEKGDDLASCLNQESSRIGVDFYVERRLASDLKKGEIIELCGLGFFIHDYPYEVLLHKDLDKALTLFAIPDGTDDPGRYPSAVRPYKERLVNKIKDRERREEEDQKKREECASLAKSD